MKYYIPTSSLNLDNILQAECISPLPFYAQRKTGYKSIELIEDVKQYPHIILFDYPVLFSIQDSGRYNYPLLIEIEDDPQFQNMSLVEKEGVYLCGHTIYLTPQNCALYFFSENAYNLTIVNAKSNKSIKYYEQYRIYSSASLLKLKDLKKPHTIDVAGICDSNETTVDKQKGLLYSLLLGQSMSITPSLSRQLMLSQKIYNVLTSIVSTPQAKDKLINNLKHLLDEYKLIDPIELKNRNMFEGKLDTDLGRFKFLRSCLIDVLYKWDVWDYVFQHLSNKWQCELLPNVTTLHTSQDFSLLRNRIENQTNNALKEYQDKQPTPSINGVSIKNNMVDIDAAPIINRVINYIIKKQLTVERLSAARLNVYKELVGEAVDEIKKSKGEEYWINSLERDYVNNLYNHILDVATPFDLKMIDNPEMVAVAAFLLRGQNINDLIAYLRLNEVCDYRYTLALWGALCGYMEMNKEILLKVLTPNNYINVYECLFHKPMGELKQALPENTPISKVDKQNYLVILKEIGIQDKFFNILKQSLETCGSSNIEKCINDILASKQCKNSTKQCSLARSAYQLAQARDDEELFRNILENIAITKVAREAIIARFFGISSSVVQNKMKKKSSDKQKSKKAITLQITEKYLEPNLFETEKTKDQLNVFNRQNINRILESISFRFSYLNKEITDLLKKDLEWVLAPKYSASLSSNDLIEKYRKLLIEGKTVPMSTNGKNMKWKNEKYKDLDIEAIVKYLHETFD